MVVYSINKKRTDYQSSENIERLQQTDGGLFNKQEENRLPVIRNKENFEPLAGNGEIVRQKDRQLSRLISTLRFSKGLHLNCECRGQTNM